MTRKCCKRGGGTFMRSLKYAARRTVHEAVRDHNRKVRPQISPAEDAWLAFLAYSAVDRCKCK